MEEGERKNNLDCTSLALAGPGRRQEGENIYNKLKILVEINKYNQMH